MGRTLVVTQNISVDSVIDATGDWFMPSGAADAGDIADMRAVEEGLRSAADALLVGRRTFEAFRGYWPQQTEDPAGVTAYLNDVAKYVVSSTLEEPGWAGTTVLRDDAVTAVQALKASDGGDIVLTGSITLLRTLQAADLVDEYRLFVYPVVVGTGRQLFEAATSQRPLDLIDTHTFKSGVVLLRYRVT